MAHGLDAPSGWIVSGFQAIVTLWIWVAAVFLYGLWRSTSQAEPDPIRPSGPTKL